MGVDATTDAAAPNAGHEVEVNASARSLIIGYAYSDIGQVPEVTEGQAVDQAVERQIGGDDVSEMRCERFGGVNIDTERSRGRLVRGVRI
jgi:hypothetical protein